MCGIFAYFWKKTTAPDIVINGLKKLEYRWYDSWWIAYLVNSEINIHKEVGKISDFKQKDFKKSSIAIGHSRWATHGKVSKQNAHPHFSENKDVVLVHNWIIENFEELKEELIEDGHKFVSDTDTEIMTHLIEKYLKYGSEVAIKKALNRLEWRFAFVIMIKGEERIYAARRGSPMILWLKNDDIFIASDIPAFLSETRDVSYIDDNEMLIIDGDWVKFQNFVTWQPIKKRVIEIDLKETSANKWDFDHFMIKEIMDQKETILSAINQKDEEIEKISTAILKSRWSFLLWCWTAWKVCQAADYFLSTIAWRHSNYVPASEFPLYHKFITDQSLIIAVSQSWETADLLEAIEVAKKKGSQILSLINVEGSSIQRASDFSLLINAGVEKAVASTKAATSQLSLLLLIAYAVAGKLPEWKRVLMETSAKVYEMLNPRYIEHIRKLAKKIHKQENIYIIGRSSNFPMALEAAIKIQEVSYIHAEGFAGGELKHWPIALIHEWVPVIALCSNDEVKKDSISNAIEVKSRGAYVIGVGPENNNAFDYWLKVPEVDTAQPILNIIPVQILAYFLAVEKGLNPDMPRNLAKSVTVK